MGVVSPKRADATPPAVEPPPETPPLSRWSDLVGRTGADRLEESGKPAVVRIVRAGVSYDPPPDGVDLPIWQESATSPQRYEIPWTDGDAKKDVRSLGELGTELRNKRPNPPEDKKQEFAAAVTRLLDLTENLHTARYRLGLVTPNNVLWTVTSGASQAFLPDFGFYQSAGSASMETPLWLDSKFQFAPLWRSGAKQGSPGPKEIQAISPQSAAACEVDLTDPQTDIRTLARLFACILTGRPEGPLRPGRPDQKVRVWHHVLLKAENGHFSTIEDFRMALEANPLWHHFSQTASTGRGGSNQGAGPNRTGRWLIPLLASAVLAGTLGLVSWIYFESKHGPVVPDPQNIQRDAEWDKWAQNWKDQFDRLMKKDEAAATKDTRDSLRKALDKFELQLKEKPIAQPQQNSEIRLELEISQKQFANLPTLSTFEPSREQWIADWVKEFDELWSSNGAARASPRTGDDLWKLIDKLEQKLRNEPAANAEQKAREDELLKSRRRAVGNLWPR